jgi:hypothetical protein
MATAIGVAVLGTVSGSRTRTLTQHGSGQIVALLGGYELAFEVGAGCVLAALVLAIVAVRTPRPERVEARAGRDAAAPAGASARAGRDAADSARAGRDAADSARAGRDAADPRPV